MHDPAIGRFMVIDPLAHDYVYNSPYAFSENHVTAHVELEGLEAVSYLLTQTIGGVGHTDIALEGDAGIIIAGAKIKGAAGIGYDSKGNFAVYGQTGGFANLFGTFGWPSTGGNPTQTGEFTLGLGGGVEVEESYNWGLNSVLDIAGDAFSLDIEVSVYKVLGIDIGFNQDSNHNLVGVNWGGVIGLGAPGDIGVTGTNTSLAAFQLGDLTDLGVSDYSISLASVAGKNGSVATQRVLDSLK